jgi:hypothetical protein
VDSSSNIYIGGHTAGALDGGSNAGGGRDVWFAKYDSSGTQLWIEQFGTTNADHLYAMAVDSSDNIYIGGRLSTGVDATDTIDGSSSGSSSRGYDVWFAKYDSSGERLWIEQFGSSSGDNMFAMAVDSSNNLYCCGYTAGALDGGTNAGNQDVWVAKYDSSKNLQWIRQFGGINHDYCNAMAVDSSNNLYIAGYTEGVLDGGSNAGGDDVWFGKFSPADGTQLWIEQTGTSLDEELTAMVVDSNNNLYIGGWTQGALDGGSNAGSKDAWFGKFSESTPAPTVMPTTPGPSKQEDQKYFFHSAINISTTSSIAHVFTRLPTSSLAQNHFCFNHRPDEAADPGTNRTPSACTDESSHSIAYSGARACTD